MKVLRRLLVFLMLMILLAAAGGGVYAIYLQRQDRAQIADLKKQVESFEPRFTKFKGAVGDLGKEFTALVLEEADLTRSGWQSIGKGFYLVDVAAYPQGTGVRIKGKIINTTAVVHENLVFRAHIKKSTGTISFARAAPAVAIPFEITLPDVAPADRNRAFIELESSTISFSSTTGKSPAGREPFDPEKILKTAN
jgi:hypothetical protein